MSRYILTERQQRLLSRAIEIGVMALEDDHAHGAHLSHEANLAVLDAILNDLDKAYNTIEIVTRNDPIDGRDDPDETEQP